MKKLHELRLQGPLPNLVYDELRCIQIELDELTLDQNLAIAAARIGRLRERVAALILASELAEMDLT